MISQRNKVKVEDN